MPTTTKNHLKLARILAPISARAATAPIPLPTVVTTGNTLVGAICTATSWIFTFLILLSIVFVLYAAFRYLKSGGDEEKVKMATRTITYAIVAVAVAILAKGVPFVVAQIVTPGGAGLSVTGVCSGF